MRTVSIIALPIGSTFSLRPNLMLKGVFSVLALFLALILCPQSQAMQFGTKGEGLSGALDVTLSYGAMFRVEDHDHNVRPMSYIDEDDGNRNFDEGLVSSLFKALAEFEIRNETDAATFGFFSRGFALWDSEIDGASNDNDSPFTNNNNAMYGGSLADNQDFTDKAEGVLGKDIDFLDAFFFGEVFQTSSYPVSFKLGWHVVNWGESTFIQQGISSVMSPADASKAALPGTEIKEILLPVNQASVTVPLNNNISISSYYQFDWMRTIAPPVGTYFSTADFIGEGAETALVPVFLVEGGLVAASSAGMLPFPVNPGDLTGNVQNGPQSLFALNRAGDDEPDDEGQFGFALTWFVEALNETEFGFYYLNYHRKLPDITLVADGRGSVNNPWTGSPGPLAGIWAGVETARFAHKYFDDVKLFGFSFNTTLPIIDTALSGEIAFHNDIPIQTKSLEAGLGEMIDAIGGSLATGGPPIAETIDLSTREDIITAGLTFLQIIRMPSIADDITLLAEVGMVHTPDLDDGEFFRGFSVYPGDDFAWGYKANLLLTYYDAIAGLIPPLSGTDVIVTLNFGHDVDGVSPIAAGSFTENEKNGGIIIEGIWKNTVSVAVGYNLFWGGGNNSAISDRDNVTFNMKWRF